MAPSPQPRLGVGARRAKQFFRTRGSVMLAALIFAAVIAISLTSYLKLAHSSLAMADRSYYQNAAVNLAEVGAEEAIACYNRLADVPIANPEQAWQPYGWTIAADNSASRTFSGFALGSNVSGSVKVHCSIYNPTSPSQRPVVVAQAIVSFPNGPALSKFVEVTLRKRSMFPRGMVVRQTIDADGGDLSLDSWNSGDDGNPATPSVVYSTATRAANASMATLSSVDDAIDVGNGNIYGYISTTGGRVRRGPTATLTGDFASTEFDTDRISTDFDVTTFPPVVLPSPSYVNHVTSNVGATTLPAGTDTLAADGCYYYNFAPGVGVQLNGGTLRMADKVVLLLTNHAGVDAVALGGSSGLTINTGATLKIYTNGNVSLTGTGGLSNGNSEPSTCVFFGTHPTPGSQTFVLRGNGHTSVSLYAPNAGITMSGGGSGGDFYGAIVGNTVRMNGTTRFHYDEALANLYTGRPFGVAKWKELQTNDERAVYAAHLNF